MRRRPGSTGPEPVARRIYRAIYVAWPTGVTTRELTAVVGRSKSVVYAQVRRLIDEGVIVKVGHGGRLYPKGYEAS